MTLAQTVLVTGAAGFIGSHAARHLAAVPGMVVVAATRDGRNGSRRLDVCDIPSVRRALAGVDAVVHCAVGGRTVTVDGTATVLREAAQAGVRRVVHLSSVGVYGAASGVVGEETPMVSVTGAGYPAWKAAAERACLAQPGIEIVRLRPAIVYGPGSQLWVATMARRIRSGRWGVLGAAGDGQCNLVHVNDVASAVTAALRSENAKGAAFNINGSDAMTWNRWFTVLADAIGAPPPRSVSPMALKLRSTLSLPLKAAARLSPGLAADWLLGAPSRSELALFALSASYPTDAARTVLGWEPQVSLADGLAGSVAWLEDCAPPELRP